jgi:hypothetical protein
MTDFLALRSSSGGTADLMRDASPSPADKVAWMREHFNRSRPADAS